MSEMEVAQVAWYVVHTYSGYENKVKANLEKTVENRGLQDMIVEVKIPVEEIVEVKNNKKKIRQQKKLQRLPVLLMLLEEMYQ